ncbi:MAG: glycosyltransferase family 2 protein [Planctomycetota bacterium]
MPGTATLARGTGGPAAQPGEVAAPSPATTPSDRTETRIGSHGTGTRRLTTACLVNHFDYGAYVGEAIESIVAQTRALDEIVVVDDGSSAEHLETLRALCRAHPSIRLIEKENGGQLSCFQVGVAATEADVVLFLDADDRWHPTYVEEVVGLLEARPEIDVVECNERRFFADGRTEVTERPSRDLGYSIARSLVNGGPWTGQPTSCLALRRSIVEKIFPLEGFEGWRTCADEALVYGSSLAGAHKFFLGTPLVDYRIHGANLFHGHAYCPIKRLVRGVEVLRLVEHMRRRHSLPASLAHVAHHEFRTIEGPSKRDYRSYRELVRCSDLPAKRKRRVAFAIWSWYRFGWRG